MARAKLDVTSLEESFDSGSKTLLEVSLFIIPVSVVNDMKKKS